MKAMLMGIYCLICGALCTNAQSSNKVYEQWKINDSISRANRAMAPQPATTDTAQVIGFAIAPLYRKQPESPLGNWLADCMYLYAQKLFNKPIDAAFVNYTGIRYYIPKGNITIGTLHRVMPYDNEIVILTVPGSIFKTFLNHTASLGGWPAAGITMLIKDKAADSIWVGNQPFSEAATYTIAVSDYIAKGGNQCSMLKGLPMDTKGYLLRDAMIDYTTTFTQAGKPVTASIENRVVQRY